MMLFKVFGEISDKETKVVFGPLVEGRVGPCLSCCGSNVILFVAIVIVVFVSIDAFSVNLSRH